MFFLLGPSIFSTGNRKFIKQVFADFQDVWEPWYINITVHLKLTLGGVFQNKAFKTYLPSIVFGWAVNKLGSTTNLVLSTLSVTRSGSFLLTWPFHPPTGREISPSSSVSFLFLTGIPEEDGALWGRTVVAGLSLTPAFFRQECVGELVTLSLMAGLVLNEGCECL